MRSSDVDRCSSDVLLLRLLGSAKTAFPYNPQYLSPKMAGWLPAVSLLMSISQHADCMYVPTPCWCVLPPALQPVQWVHLRYLKQYVLNCCLPVCEIRYTTGACQDPCGHAMCPSQALSDGRSCGISGYCMAARHMQLLRTLHPHWPTHAAFTAGSLSLALFPA